jgi:23S rRNA (pseudouridine1915-N3)-methyltransferase
MSGGYGIALCVEGKFLSSEALAALLEKCRSEALVPVRFLIGSSYGLSKQVKAACRLRLSLSPMTLPHQLARVVLAEQIYRALTICAGERYHK